MTVCRYSFSKLKNLLNRLRLRLTILTFSAFIFLSNIDIQAQENDVLIFFDKPAETFIESLPLGNGRLGAMVFGGTKTDRIALNEISLWSGGPQDADREDAWQYLKPIQEHLIKGENKKAQELLQKHFVSKGVGSGYGNGANEKYGSYQTFGDLLIHWLDSNAVIKDYTRKLNLENAVAVTSYLRNGNKVTQEVFTDFKNDIIWIKLSAEGRKILNFDLELYRLENSKTELLSRNQLLLKGQLPSKNDPGMQFAAIAELINIDGILENDENKLKLRGASECIIRISAVTNYNYYSGGLLQKDVVTEALNFLETPPDFGSAKEESINIYQKYFNKSRITLPYPTSGNPITTQERLIKYREGSEDHQLAALYYHFGRYLLISSSRPGLLPANLQGLWATEYQAPWNGDYHLNINLQMNYWPAVLTGLGDLAEPLYRFAQNLVKNGEKTAKAYYNAEGWVAHVISNPWFYTSPGEGADWGSTLTGGAWLCSHIWEHYRFTQDKEFLKQYYPVLKGAAQFINSILIEEPKGGWLVTAPSNSPEHAYVMPDGFRGSTAMGPTMDMQIARELFNANISAAKILKTDRKWQKELEGRIKRLAPNQIGQNGDLNEWLDDWEDSEPRHRHVSHLYGLHPYDEINQIQTPELFDAAKKTLEIRGDEGTGWSMAWKINFWARLKDGDHALELLKKLLKPVYSSKMEMRSGGGTYPNLFCAHPPFQIDGNFGATAGIAEMLVQSNEERIEILPALPTAWPNGKITGLRARGGFVIDMEWEDYKIVELRITSLNGNPTLIKLPNELRVYNPKNKPISKKKKNLINLKTGAGQTYLLK